MESRYNMHCPICEADALVPETAENEVTYKGHTRRLPMLMSVCQACGSEQASAQQTRDNKRTTLAFRKEIDGLLTGAELRALRERLGISQKQAARLFGGGPVAFSKYETDDVTQSEAMDRLIRLAEEVPDALQWLAQRAGETELAASASGQGFSNYLVAMARYAKFVSLRSRAFEFQDGYTQPRQTVKLTERNEGHHSWEQYESVVL